MRIDLIGLTISRSLCRSLHRQSNLSALIRNASLSTFAAPRDTDIPKFASLSASMSTAPAVVLPQTGPSIASTASSTLPSPASTMSSSAQPVSEPQAQPIEDKYLAHAANKGNLELVRQYLDQGMDVNAPNKKFNTALHMAAAQRQDAIVRLLIERGADINRRNGNGKTPLMMAVVGRCNEALLRHMLEHGADLWSRCFQRLTPMDYARNHNHRAAQLLFEEVAQTVPDPAESLRTSGDKLVCPICGDRLRRRSKLSYLEQFVDDEASPDMANLYIRRFKDAGFLHSLQTDPRLHRITEQNKMRKEITESMAILDNITANRKRLGLESQRVRFIDLCSGKSLTSTLFMLDNPSDDVVAIDKMSKALAPHLDGNASYMQADILRPAFDREFSKLVQDDVPCILGAMHLCGLLSIRAIELFEKHDNIVALVLSPCCLPGAKSPLRIALDSGSKDSLEQYYYWADYLCAELKSRGFAVTKTLDPHIMSQRNVVITAVRPDNIATGCD